VEKKLFPFLVTPKLERERESSIAIDLEKIQDRYPDIDIGSYPYSKEGSFGTVLVMRSTDEEKVLKCKAEVENMLQKYLNI